MFPHCSDDHYRMYVVNLKNKRYDYLDSLYPDDLDSKFRAVADMVVRYATEYIPACREEPFKFEEFKWVRQRGVRQRGGVDCGVFTMNFAEFWDGKLHPAMRNWQRQINQRRDEITLTLLLNKENSVLEEVKKKSLEFDRKVD
ncbi:unnamed protein product [Linum tenue]|uniref:Ubiquitin-like protease family profile domain-containing protein n=1 Tax=Linum tenue TaxID=586396 RepID=A0AAV0MFU7_9ROSI|nr:unnamed protein product [Linum tenue]